MSNFNYDEIAGQTINFNPTTDILVFGDYFDAAQLRFKAEGVDLIINDIRLASVSYGQLNSNNFSFANGSIFVRGTTANNTINSSLYGDYIDISQGGSDTVSTNEGSDIVVVGAALDAADRIDGGTSYGYGYQDEIIFSGNYNNYVELNNTIKGFEEFTFLNGTIKIKLDNAVFNSVENYNVVFDASAQLQTDALYLDGSNVTTGIMTVYGGAGNDTIMGGAYNDYLKGDVGQDKISGGAGDDLIIGGLDADTLTGGAGNDTFRFAFGALRSDSSPTTIDLITDFSTGDLLDIPGYNSYYNFPLIFNAQALNFNYTGGTSGLQANSNAGDGLADIFWKWNGSAIELWVDANDDGQFSEQDLLIHIQGSKTSLTEADFVHDFYVIRGTANADTINAESKGNVIYALAGNDVINGNSGNDVVYAAAGNDTVYGGSGDDTLHGGSGADTLYGGEGSDTLYADGIENSPHLNSVKDAAGTINILNGGAGNDALYGGAGNDTLNGDGDDDTLYGYAGNDTLNGGDGNDYLSGGTGNDVLDGGTGNDYLEGGSGQDILRGESGDDILVNSVTDSISQHGIYDEFDGGSGNDTLNFDSGGLERSQVIATGGEGADTFVFYSIVSIWNSENYTTSTVGYSDRITDFNPQDGDKIDLGVSNGLGGVYNSSTGFYSNEVPLVWRGDVSNSSFTATLGQSVSLAGEDTGRFLEVFSLYDAASNQTKLYIDRNLNGVVDSTDALITFDGLVSLTRDSFVEGTFTLKTGTNGNDSDTTPALSDDSDLAYGLSGDDTLSGLDGDDTLNGDGGNDTLSGDEGNDKLYGGTGNDTLYGGTGNDTLRGGTGADVLNGGDDSDTLYAEGQNSSDDSAGVADAAGTINILNGGAGNDVLYGGAGNDTLNGDGDDDTLYGYAGNDTLNGGDGNDYLSGGTGNDVLDGGTGNDYLEGGSGQDILRGGSGDDILVNSVTDSISQHGIYDEFDGGSGNDTLNFDSGGSERSQVIATGGEGADTFVFDSIVSIWNSENYTTSTVGYSDRITDFNPQDGDKIDLGVSNGLGGVYNSSTGFYGYEVPLVWRGDVSNSSFTATLGQSVSLAGEDTGRFLEVFSLYDAASNQTKLYIDRNLNGVVDSTDALITFDGLVSLTRDSFVEGTFTLKTGTNGNDSDTTPALSDDSDLAYGLSGDDTLSGLDGDDTLNGDGGNDTLSGDEGNDKLYGGTGNDTLYGGTGNDTLRGGTGADVLNGGDDSDTLYAEGQNSSDDSAGVTDAAGTINILNGGAGNDALYGGAGNDTLNGDGDDDTLYGYAGNDTLNGGDGNDYLSGGTGNDVLDGGTGNDYLEGGSGQDILRGGSGDDILVNNVTDSISQHGIYDEFDGGSGNDTLNFDSGGSERSQVIATGGEGADTFVFDSIVSIWNSENYTTSTVGYSDRITDFNPQDGDKIDLGVSNGLGGVYNSSTGFYSNEVPLVWRGDVSNSSFTATLGQSVSLAGEDTGRFLEVFSLYDAASNQTKLYIDRNLNGVVDSTDALITFDGLVSLTRDSFVEGTFTLKTGTNGNDSDTTPALSDDSDLAYGLSGDDTLSGLDGDDTLNGDGGNDTLSGDEGNDTLYGGTGNDTLYGGSGSDTLRGGTGADVLNGGDDSDILYAEGQNSSDDSAGVTDAAGTINILNGGAGNDVLYGGAGNDTLNGDGDDDTLYGYAGNDTLNGGDGNDYLSGGTGNDVLDGGTGNDYLEGGSGQDILRGESGDDILVNSVTDSISQHGIYDEFDGGSGNDTLNFDSGGSERSQVIATGGEGADTFVFYSIVSIWNSENYTTSTVGYSDRITDFNPQDGDKIDLGVSNGLGGVYNSSTGFYGYEVPLVWRGDVSNSSFTATIGQNVNLAGTPTGNLDLWRIYDATANQTKLYIDRNVNGVVESTDGLIILEGNIALDQNSFVAGELFQVNLNIPTTTPTRIYSSANYTLPSSAITVELELTGTDHIQGIGNEYANLLIGNSGNNILDGRAGADTLQGNWGDDTYYVDNIGDIIIEKSNEGIDLVYSSVDYKLTDHVENLSLLGSAHLKGTGNSLNNIITGNSGDNILNGGMGNDTLYGSSGDDQLFGEAGQDTLYGGSGNDLVDGGEGNDIIWAGSGADTVKGGAGDDQLNGDSGNDKIYGGDGNDLINSGSGNDTVNGDDGDDILNGGSGNDTLNGGAGNDQLNGGSGKDKLDGGAGDDVLNGGSGDDILNGGSGHDVLYGGSGNDTLLGGSGNDLLYGGNGLDVFTGGSGSDTVIYQLLNAAHATGGNGTDTWTDFTVGSASDADKIDIRELLSDYHGDGSVSSLSAYIQVLQQGTDTVVKVDRDGGGTAFGSTHLLSLQNVHTDLSTLLDNHQILY